MTDATNAPSDRLDALEIRIAHQDQTIDELNAAITAQWKLIDRLERQIAVLHERVSEGERGRGEATPIDRPPPHY